MIVSSQIARLELRMRRINSCGREWPLLIASIPLTMRVLKRTQRRDVSDCISRRLRCLGCIGRQESPDRPKRAGSKGTSLPKATGYITGRARTSIPKPGLIRPKASVGSVPPLRHALRDGALRDVEICMKLIRVKASTARRIYD